MLPNLRQALSMIGENIKFARLRRNYSTQMVSERAGISRPTLNAIEKGDPTVAIGSFANVLLVLGLEKDLLLLAANDPLGRKLQDAKLPTKARSSRKNSILKAKDESK